MKSKEIVIPYYEQILPGGRSVMVKDVRCTMYLIDGQWEEAFDRNAIRKIEQAVEKAFPGWYHRFNKDGTHQKDCISCKRYGGWKQPRS